MSDGAARTAAKSASATRAAPAPRRAPAAPQAASVSPAAELIAALNGAAGNRAISGLLGGSAALPAELRNEMELRFAQDFSDVRLHLGPGASASADLLDANAFTHGTDIVFSAQQYSPFTSRGKQLIAHELAHVVQQRRGGPAPLAGTHAPHEVAAEAAAQAYATTSAPIAVSGATGAGVACDEKRRPADEKFLADAFHANRYHAWSKKIANWPVDPRLAELWSKLGVAPSREQNSKGGYAEADKVIKRPEYTEFVQRVRDFQYQVFPKVDRSIDGIVDPSTAAKLSEREEKRAEQQRRAEAEARQRKLNEEKRLAAKRVMTATATAGGSFKGLAKASSPTWTERAQGAASSVLGTVQGAVEDPVGTYESAKEKAGATYESAKGVVQKAADDPIGTLKSAAGAIGDFSADYVKQLVVDALTSRLPFPKTGMKLAIAVGEGMGEQLYQELVREGKGTELLKRFKDVDYGELQKGYAVGVVEGLVSPVTDLYGLLVFGEKMNNLLSDALLKAIANIGKVGGEARALLESAGTLAKSLKEFIDKVKQHPEQVIAAVLSAPEAIEKHALEGAKRLGREGGSAIVRSLEEPWKPAKLEEPDPLKAPLAYGEYLAKKGEAYVLDTPWAKVGSKFGYAIGFIVIQVLLLVFTSGIGNGITKAASALGEVGAALGKLGSTAAKAAGAAATRIAELVGALGKAITWIENGIAKALSWLIEKLPGVGKVLKPVGDLMERLKKFLQKLLGVAEKETGAVLDAAAGKTANVLGDDASKAVPHPPAPPPNVTPPPKVDASKTAGQGSNVQPIVSQKKPPVSEASKKLEQNLAKQPADKVGTVTPIGKGGKPDPLPPVQSQKIPVEQVQEDVGKVAVGQSHGSGTTASQTTGGKGPQLRAVHEGDPIVASSGKKTPSQGVGTQGKPPPHATTSGSASGSNKPTVANKPPPKRLPPPLKLSNAKAPKADRLAFVRQNRALLGPNQQKDLAGLGNRTPSDAQLRLWEKRIDQQLRAQSSDQVASAIGTQPGSVSAGRRPESGLGADWERTHAGLRGEPPNDVTYTVRTETDQAQFDSLGKPGGKVEPIELKAYDNPPTDYTPKRRVPFDSYEQILQNNRDAARGAERVLADEESRLWKARELADQMERQARIAQDRGWPAVKWPMHSERVADYFTTEVLPLVKPAELRNKIRLVAEYYFD